MFVPQDVERIEHRFGAAEQQFSELRLTVRIEADDLAIENTAAASEVTSQPLADAEEGLEYVAVPGYEPHAVLVGVEQRPEAVTFDLEEPVGMVKWLPHSGKRH